MNFAELQTEEEQETGHAAQWMVTFADLVTILLAFFVLLLSFSNTNREAFRDALGSVRDSLGVKSQSPGQHEALSTTPIEFSDKQSADKETAPQHIMLDRLREMLQQQGLGDAVEAVATGDGLTVRIKDNVLYASGSADVLERGKPFLDGLAEIARLHRGPLRLEGHSDDQPIHTPRYPSNWELSSARASAVLHYLGSKGAIDYKRVSVAGYADQRPLTSNTSEQGRARNRRVEIVFLGLDGL